MLQEFNSIDLRKSAKYKIGWNLWCFQLFLKYKSLLNFYIYFLKKIFFLIKNFSFETEIQISIGNLFISDISI